MRAGVLLISAITMVSGFVMRPAGEQDGGKESGSVRLSHIGIVVPDVDPAVRLIASLTGTDKSAIRAPEGRAPAGLARTTHVRLSNISLELLQPAADPAITYRNLVQEGGIGVHHLGLERDPAASTPNQVNRLVQVGGKVIAQDSDRAFVDLSSRLGPLFEISSPALHDRLYRAGAPAPRLDPTSPFAQPTCVTHVGIVVRDIEQARQTYEELLGVVPSPIQPLEAATGSARYTFFKLQNTTIELLQQAAGVKGAYADFLGANGHRVHHIGLHLRGRDARYRTVPQQLAWLEQHGGKIGVNAGGFAYVDVGLGVFVEALSEESINRVYPCN